MRVLLIGLVLICLIPGVIGAAALIYEMDRGDRERTQARTIRTARALAQAVDGKMAIARSVAQALATSAQLAASDLPGFHQRAREVLRIAGVGANVVLSDAAGQQVLNTLRPLGETLPAHGNPALLTRVLGTARPAVSDVFVSGTTGKPILSVDVPAIVDGRAVYGLSLVLAPQDLGSLLRDLALPAGWIASVTDRSGNTAARSINEDRFIGTKANPELLRQRALAPDGAFATLTREGIAADCAFSLAPGSGWTVAIAIPHSELQAPWQRASTQLAAGVVALVALAGVLAWRQGGRITRSVQAFRSIGRVACSRLSSRVIRRPLGATAAPGLAWR